MMGRGHWRGEQPMLRPGVVANIGPVLRVMGHVPDGIMMVL
jgi:hypothetical protein